MKTARDVAEKIAVLMADALLGPVGHAGRGNAVAVAIKAIESAILAENEECAKVADDPWAYAPSDYATGQQLCEGIAKAIRARVRTSRAGEPG